MTPPRPLLAPAALLLGLAPFAPAQDAPTQPDQNEPVYVGAGAHRYRWDEAWGARPDGQPFGKTHGCMAIDRTGHVYCNTDTDHAVVVLDAEGRLIREWGEGYAGGMHGMAIVAETVAAASDGDAADATTQEFVYLAHTGRHEVVKATLAGNVQWTLGCPMESGVYEKASQYRPTGVAVAADGRIFVADGYGKSWVHVFDADRKYLKSFGGKGTEPDKFRTPHGLWLDERGDEPSLIVCDRENHRLKWYSLDGELQRIVDEGLRRPCNVTPLGDRHWAVADLTGRVTILDAEGAVVEHLGEQPEPSRRATSRVAPEHWRPGEFLSPHGIAADPAGNLYVLDWNDTGRVSRLVLDPEPR